MSMTPSYDSKLSIVSSDRIELEHFVLLSPLYTI